MDGKTKIFADSYFCKGVGHRINQDYSVVAYTDDLVFAVVCDGCSSSPRTEVGAALLANVFIQSYLKVDRLKIARSLEDNNQTFDIYLETAMQATLDTVRELVGLPLGAMDATLLAAVADKANNVLWVYAWGDGHIILKRKDGAAELRSFSYSDNAPNYFAYRLDGDRQVEYKKRFDGRVTMLSQPLGQEDLMEGPYRGAWLLDAVKSVALFSDGVDTFSLEKDGKTVHIPADEIIANLSDFKNPIGQFVDRRFHKAMKNYRAENITHFDDVSCAAIINEDSQD